MAKKRTGLQSDIAGIFSGVPVPKKGAPRSKSGGSPQKPDDKLAKTDGPVKPKPVASQPVTPKPLALEKQPPQQKVEPVPVISQPKVPEVKVSGKSLRRSPRKVYQRRKDKVFTHKAGVSSSRQKAGIILFIVFSTALVIVLARPYLTPNNNPAVSRTTRNTDAGNSVRANVEINWPMPPVYSADLPDPMYLGPRKQKKVETRNGLVVRGISYSEDRKFAVIGTETKQEGDTIQGITIVEITPNSVVFEKDGKRWTQIVEREG